jgi:hypothetical protein
MILQMMIWHMKKLYMARTTPIVGIFPTPCLLKCKESKLFALFILDEIRIEIEGYWWQHDLLNA